MTVLVFVDLRPWAQGRAGAGVVGVERGGRGHVAKEGEREIFLTSHDGIQD